MTSSPQQLNARLLATLVRDKRGSQSLRDAAESAGIAFSTLGRLEKMTGAKPDLETIERVAAWLGVALGTLFAVSEPVEAHLRAKKTLSSATARALRDLIVAARAQYRLHPIERTAPDEDDEAVDSEDSVGASRQRWEEIARGIRTSLNVKDEEPLDPFTIRIPRVMRVGVSGINDLSEITRDQLVRWGQSEWSAATIPLLDADTDWLILLNDSHTVERQRSTLMEEFCHVLLGHELSQISAQEGVAFRDYRQQQETEAFYVGAATLVPEADLRRRIAAREPADVVAAHFGVSRELVEFRIKRLGLWYLYQLGIARTL